LTDLSPPDGPAAPDETSDSPVVEPAPTRAPGLTTFTMEGRKAPALFVVGWLATIIGGGFLALTFLGLQGPVRTVIALVGLVLLTLGMLLLGGSQTVERRAAGASYAGPSPVLVFIAVFSGAQLLGFPIGLVLLPFADRIPSPIASLLGELVKDATFLVILWLMVVGPRAMAWPDMGLRRGLGRAVNGLVTGAVFAGPLVLITALVAGLAVQLLGAAPGSPLPPSGTSLGLVANLVTGAILAPVAEELLFRGFALTAWRRMVSDRGAIVRSSIIFVLAHVAFIGGDSFGPSASVAVVAGVTRVPVALALGWLYVRTGSLWAPIGLHAAFNAILIVVGELAVRGVIGG
jgi:membrane protease YdiL (CAAX protease family)